MIELQREVTLDSKIAARAATVAVIGLGYVGLPLALAFGRAGFTVLGLERDREKSARLREGSSYIEDVPSAEVARLRESGHLEPSCDPTCLAQADVIVICVPTPYTKAKQPDLSYVRAAGEEIARCLRPGQLVILESTTYPGTTEEVLQPMLERGGLRCGEDFELAYSPERVDPGNKQFGIRNTPKIVGGVTPRATELAAALYGAVAERVVRVSGTRAAEMAKLMENTFRHINIALANEMAILCGTLGIDIWEVIDAAATKPFGFMPFYPGPGVGGHCIPIDPYYFAWKVQEHEAHARFIDLAGQINDRMPDVVVERVSDALNEQGKSVRSSRILLLGVSYKKDVGDVRESPALKVIERLHRKGAVVAYHDPHVPAIDHGAVTMASTPLTAAELQAADCVLILTDHSSFPYQMILEQAQTIVDTRNALRGIRAAKVVRL